MAYTQWTCGLGFSDLFEVAPLDWVIGSYHPLHEASEVKFAQIVIDKWNKAQAGKKGLKAARKAAGLTQKQLAAQSGVKIRAIQLYEQNQLDLRRASVSSALALAKPYTAASKTSSGSRSFLSTTPVATVMCSPALRRAYRI